MVFGLVLQMSASAHALVIPVRNNFFFNSLGNSGAKLKLTRLFQAHALHHRAEPALQERATIFGFSHESEPRRRSPLAYKRSALSRRTGSTVTSSNQRGVRPGAERVDKEGHRAFGSIENPIGRVRAKAKPMSDTKLNTLEENHDKELEEEKEYEQGKGEREAKKRKGEGRNPSKWGKTHQQNLNALAEEEED
jgi:hypothetical protein